MVTVYLALGSNLGDRLANLRAALHALEMAGLRVTATSSVWETDPIPPGQPPYLNAVVRAETALSPQDLLRTAKRIERELGRTPGPRWGPRVVDIDILLYGEERFATAELEVPHPRVAERAFVLAPLAEVTSGPLPVLGRSAAELLALVGQHGILKLALPLRPPEETGGHRGG